MLPLEPLALPLLLAWPTATVTAWLAPWLVVCPAVRLPAPLAASLLPRLSLVFAPQLALPFSLAASPLLLRLALLHALPLSLTAPPLLLRLALLLALPLSLVLLLTQLLALLAADPSW